MSKESTDLQSLIQTLTLQHQEIAKLAGQLDAAVVAGDTTGLQDLMVRLKRALLAHLELEDARLYPALVQAANKTKAEIPIKIAETFAKNMQGVTAALKAFLDKYVVGEIDVADFRRDWLLVHRLLDDRIESEERHLYPLHASSNF